MHMIVHNRGTQYRKTVLLIFSLIEQTVITAQVLSVGVSK